VSLRGATGVRRRLLRTVAALLGAVVLLVPSMHAIAVDDPQPVQWPKIEQTDDGGNESDPGPVKWITIPAPDNDGEGNDPKPLTWPAPEER